MEALYLICSIVSTLVTSSILSLLLAFHSRRRILSPSTPPADKAEEFAIYEGVVWHERRRPVHHEFSYAVRYALFDLDHAPDALPCNHLSSDHARQITGTDGPVFLLTIPPSVGYEQNPLSVYYCYGLEGSNQQLKKCIAEVTNTPWGERVNFVFNPNADLVAKPLHVSPFMDMLGDWTMRVDAPGDKLFIKISVQHPELGDYFRATLTAKRVPRAMVNDHALFFWLMPHKVAFWIYWQALNLWWKGVPFLQHPKYSNPRYRKEALIRDQKLQCCRTFGQDKKEHVQVERTDSSSMADSSSSRRCFTWINAPWPWS